MKSNPDIINKFFVPRVEVVAEWPRGLYRKDSIITYGDKYETMIDKEPVMNWVNHHTKYPHLFRVMAWHERRPLEWFYHINFVRVTSKELGYWIVGDIVPVSSLVLSDGRVRLPFVQMIIVDPNRKAELDWVEPATEDDYKIFKKKK